LLVDGYDIGDLLDRKADDYEIRAAVANERGEAGDIEEADSVTAFTLIAIVLREVADAVRVVG
jgi:hypothetical protein